MNLYSVDIKIAATAYIKANSEKEARKLARGLKNSCLELREDEYGEVPISGKQFDDPDLPDVSLSPAMTLLGIIPGTLDISEEDLPEGEDDE